MGLDMYLWKGKRNNNDKTTKWEQFAYWRKFDALHSFMCEKSGTGLNFYDKPLVLTRDIVKELIIKLEKNIIR